MWYNLVLKLVHANLNEGVNLFIWNLHKNGFTVKSMYKHLINNNTLVAKKKSKTIYTQEIYCTKIPLKIKSFMWFIKRG